MKPLFLNPPTYEDFDGGAGARYQASREVTSFWYPTWLCFPAGMIDGSRVVDAPVQRFTIDDCLAIARDFDMVVMYTSTPTLALDIATARRVKEQKPATVTVLTGPHVSVLPEETLRQGEGVIDIVCRGEFDYTTKELCEGREWAKVDGISFWKDGKIHHTPDRPPIQDLDALPFVAPVYKRDLPIAEYVIPHFKNPYVSIYSSRGCPSKCIYCLWPQTFSGRAMRTRSPQNVYEEVKWIVDNIPEMRELSFDDDTFTADRKHAREVAAKLKPLGISWTINARANCDYETLKIMREAGLRHVVVGYETGNEQILKNIKKGVTKEQAIEFTRNCKKLGLSVHGAFIMGLPGETRDTIRETIEYAKALDLNSIQASLASPYPGTEFWDLCRQEGWIASEAYIDDTGHQMCVINYPHLSNKEIFDAVELFYNKFYFRPKYIGRSIMKMIVDGEERKKLLKEGKQYLEYMRKRKAAGSSC
ncbi:hopanoid biosynthesis associated radical SAM protein HpnJ [Geobacter metallireducens RCH3]|uniref:Radical SAM domain iron-sulfur cluster-binding oxidoreductase with cobalamin-binding-like domain n=1 Tax=Geobacter metallireducens (strain ATCC 53774 / DSM 7210 / GS-15) TaxID=269799 RepID=Q39SY3_GEOMG|nr:hopanoid biosynthesis associated radical SAM protein HpnJ [Geobacter metallireducens]ABB32641.1 radical SAM domain iron-sulfur cluster-binding oxidoreductase with cobalamin-binding-like domain [Geobacter metallireducens GS-15]EHP87866.1 hopanoid biosynthesis associated radical SAM protein HpnJ [Geobacter metallireducens RCH3]